MHRLHRRGRGRLFGVNIKGNNEFNVAHVVGAKLDVHESGDKLISVGVLVVLHTLDQGRSTVSNTNNCYTDFSAGLCTHFLPLLGYFLLIN